MGLLGRKPIQHFPNPFLYLPLFHILLFFPLPLILVFLFLARITQSIGIMADFCNFLGQDSTILSKVEFVINIH